jgi:hypothetical protein
VRISEVDRHESHDVSAAAERSLKAAGGDRAFRSAVLQVVVKD